jgi:hypothetical protein
MAKIEIEVRSISVKPKQANARKPKITAPGARLIAGNPRANIDTMTSAQ